MQGIKAVDCILEFTPESPALMISIKETDIFAQPLMKAVEMVNENAFSLFIHTDDLHRLEKWK